MKLILEGLNLATTKADKLRQGMLMRIQTLTQLEWPMPHYYFDIKDGHRLVDPSGFNFDDGHHGGLKPFETSPFDNGTSLRAGC